MDLEPLKIVSDDGAMTAEFVPGAGMLCCSLTDRDEELLDAGKGVDAYAQRGATMAIPLLYPWANRLAGDEYEVLGRRVALPQDPSRIPRDPGGLPIHGVVPGRMRWHGEPPGRTASLSARLQWDNDELLALFPFEHEVRIDAEVTAGALQIATTVHAQAGNPVPVSFGFHPYLRLPGSHREPWRVQLPAMQRLRLDGQMIPTGEHEPFPQREFALAETSWDDGFKLADRPARFVVSDANRRIALEMVEGFPYAQIYAPPGRDFICFEPMTAPTNALCSGAELPVLDPGQEHRAVFRVQVSRA